MSQKRVLLTFASIAVALMLTACGGSKSSSSSSSNNSLGAKLFGTCNHTNLANANDRQCREWRGSTYATFDLTVSCSTIGGTYSTEPCPSSEKLGTCILNHGGALETHFVYYASDFTLVSAEDSCLAKETISLGGNLTATWSEE